MMVPYSEFEIKADDARGHRVRITFKDGRKPVEGYCAGFPAHWIATRKLPRLMF